MQSIQVRWFLPLSFFIFISYIIFLADTADYNFAFMLIGHVPYGFGFHSYKVSGRGHPDLQLGSIIVLTFATFEEFSQYFIPSRTFDFWDLLADFIGVILFSIWRKI